MSKEQVAGSLVLLFAGAYTYSLYANVNKRHPARHVLLVIGGSFVVVPYLFQTSPAWYGIPMQITANVAILLLDWFSFHEDKTRFSEALDIKNK